jgi:hypothetical protein
MLYSATSAESAESLEVLEGDMEIYENDSSFEDKIKTESAKLKISGMSKLNTWHMKHPITKQQIRGAIYAWSPGSSNVAKRMKSKVTSDEIPDEFSAAAQKQKEAKGTGSKRSNSQPKPSGPRQTLSGAGSSGSDDF